MTRMGIARRLRALIVAFLFLPWAAVHAQEAMILPVDPNPLVIDSGGKQISFSIEVADDSAKRSRGLMFRKEMDADRGMLFVFQMQQPLAFWMKNTILPLDLVFIDSAGKVQAILPGTPFSEAPISPGVAVQYVLELNQGTAARHGITPGAAVRHPLINSAVQ